jgi:hypothetical protein
MRRLLCGLALVSALAGCGGQQAIAPVTESQAYERVESYVRRAATALPESARLEASEPAASVVCKGEPRGRVKVVSTYWVRGLGDDSKHFDTLVTWWTAHDFEVLDDLRPERHYVWVENTADDFRMSMRDNGAGDLLLAAESPCVTAG